MFQDVVLKPGVTTQLSKELNEGGISVSQQIRFKSGLAQKLGGWTPYYGSPVSSTPVRDIHAFQGIQVGSFNQPRAKYVAAASLSNITITSCGILTDITPQTTVIQTTALSTNPVTLSISSGSNVVTVHAPASNASIFGGVHFDVTTAIGNLLMFGLYPINTVIDSSTFTVISSIAASTTISSSGIVPIFHASSGSAIVDVFLPNNQFLSVLGLFYQFVAPLNGIINFAGIPFIGGPYQITSIIDSTNFRITANGQATATVGSSTTIVGPSVTVYNVVGPPQAGGTYGAGNYGAGQYGFGTPAVAGTGTKITLTDCVLDNWGEQLVAVPQNGPIYIWAADLNYNVMQPIFAGPWLNIGGFVSQPQQMIFVYGSTMTDGFRFTDAQDPLLVRWCDSGNYNTWMAAQNNAAGSFRIPTGSTLIGGLQAPLFAVVWTDIDVWTATWAGQPIIWSWLRVGTGCGLIGEHAADVAQGVVYWCGRTNFYTMGANGVTPLPCTVWDYIFQNIDLANQSKVRAASNSLFNEISWFFPVAGGNGENSAYVKLHIGEGNEFEWDYGMLSRTAWVDTTVVGPPIGSDINGNLLQHETSFDAAGTPINAYLETGYFEIGDGTDIPLIDWCLPDMKWGATGQAGTSGTVLFTFFAADYPGDTELVYGPYAVTQRSQYIGLRIRKRFLRVRIESNDLNSFWRIGRIKFRFGVSGHR